MNDQKNSPDNSAASEQTPKMKWFKFLIYVYLFLTAILRFIEAIFYGLGLSYGEDMTTIYSYYSGMQILNIIYGLFFVAMGGMAIYVRQQLAHYKENGPNLFIAFFIIDVAGGIVYLLLSSLVMDGFVIGGTTFVSGLYFLSYILMTIIPNAIYVILNVIYFNNRKSLFKN